MSIKCEGESIIRHEESSSFSPVHSFSGLTRGCTSSDKVNQEGGRYQVQEARVHPEENKGQC